MGNRTSSVEKKETLNGAVASDIAPPQIPDDAKATAAESSGPCPMRFLRDDDGKVKKPYMHPKQYNVYGQEINPANNMPASASQDKSPDQVTDLSTERQVSSIPKGGTVGTWTYPSAQMFWNALHRKGKIGDTKEGDMDIVVAIHNSLNEKTWEKVMEWERLDDTTAAEQPRPTLLRFEGRPDQLSPKAWMRYMIGYIKPFDRHDWFVERAGKERRYVIDYYHAEANGGSSQSDASEAELFDSLKRVSNADSSLDNILVDVRPAIDGFDSFVFRYMKMPAFRKFFMTDIVPVPVRLPDIYKRKKNRDDTVRVRANSKSEGEVLSLVASANEKCGKHMAALQACSGDDCNKINLALHYCMSSIVCPIEKAAFDAELGKDGGAIDAAFENMQRCLRAAPKKSK